MHFHSFVAFDAPKDGRKRFPVKMSPSDVANSRTMYLDHHKAAIDIGGWLFSDGTDASVRVADGTILPWFTLNTHNSPPTGK
jgi:hypothetical protein